MKKIFVTLAFLFALNGCSHSPARARVVAEEWDPLLDSIGEDGGRVSVHGMVVFGSNGTYYVEHIPMLHKPHDAQIVAQVSLKTASGGPVLENLSENTFTFKPRQFSLNDWVSGVKSSVTGTIYSGSFEQDGTPIASLSNVTVKVIAFKLIRLLPSDTGPATFDIDGAFETEIIKSTNNVQRITRLGSPTAELWCVTGPDFFEPCQK